MPPKGRSSTNNDGMDFLASILETLAVCVCVCVYILTKTYYFVPLNSKISIIKENRQVLDFTAEHFSMLLCVLLCAITFAIIYFFIHFCLF